VYKKAIEDGYRVEATFHSDESNYCGDFVNGVERIFEIPTNPNNVRSRIPKYIDELYSISSCLDDYREDNSDYECSDTEDDE